MHLCMVLWCCMWRNICGEKRQQGNVLISTPTFKNTSNLYFRRKTVWASVCLKFTKFFQHLWKSEIFLNMFLILKKIKNWKSKFKKTFRTHRFSRSKHKRFQTLKMKILLNRHFLQPYDLFCDAPLFCCCSSCKKCVSSFPLLLQVSHQRSSYPSPLKNKVNTTRWRSCFQKFSLFNWKMFTFSVYWIAQVQSEGLMFGLQFMVPLIIKQKNLMAM